MFLVIVHKQQQYMYSFKDQAFYLLCALPDTVKQSYSTCIEMSGRT